MSPRAVRCAPGQGAGVGVGEPIAVMSGWDGPGWGMIGRVRELMDLTGRWWDWRLDVWDSSMLRLVADNDLTYHHSVEVSFTDVAWAAIADAFHHPTFRPATPAEREFAEQVADDAGYELYAWDAETAAGTVPMLIVARSVRITDGLVRYAN